MSCVAVPRTFAERPPIVPPVRTTFDGAPSGDDGDKWIAGMERAVDILIRHADASVGESLDFHIEFMTKRRELFINETLARYMMRTDTPLPSVLGLPLDFLISDPSREERAIKRLVDRLEDCIARCKRRLDREKFEARLVEQLDKGQEPPEAPNSA